MARVLKVDYVKGFVQLSLKSSQIRTDATNPLSAFSVDQIVNGTVRRVTDFGVFVELQNSTIVGLARKAFCFEASNNSQKLDAVFQLGDVVKARILSISPETGKLALDLRQSTFSNVTQSLPAEISEEEPTAMDVSDSEEEFEELTNSKTIPAPELRSESVRYINGTAKLFFLSCLF